MLNPVKYLLEVHKDVVEVLLMLTVPLTYYPDVENLFFRATSCWEADVAVIKGFLLPNDLAVIFSTQL